MIEKTNLSMIKRGRMWVAFLLLLAVFLLEPDRGVAQCTCPWVLNGTNINNTNNGNVGIGTSAPVGPLHVATESIADTRGIISSQHSADGASAGISFRKTRGTILSPAPVVNGDNIGNLFSYGYDGMSFVGGARIRFSIDGPVTTGSVPTNLQFFTGSSGLGTEQMRITSAGNVGIGTATPASKLEVIGNIALSPNSRITSLADWGNYVMPYESVTGRMVFRTAGVDRVSILYSGNVGIGTIAPSEKLEISEGSLYMRGEGAGVIVDAAGLKRVGFMKYFGKEAGIWRVNDQDFEIGRVNPQVTGLPGNPTAFTTDLYIAGSGNIGVGTTTPAAKLHVVGDATITGTGNLSASGTITAGNIVAKYQDIAEWVSARHTIPAGTVVVLDTEKSNQVVASHHAYDTRVAGVVSDSPGVILGEGGEGKVMVATTGRVKVKVDAAHAPIRVGDLLVTSHKEGIAMRSKPLRLGGTPIHRPGTVIGKALQPLDKGIGEILVLLSLQ